MFGFFSRLGILQSASYIVLLICYFFAHHALCSTVLDSYVPLYSLLIFKKMQIFFSLYPSVHLHILSRIILRILYHFHLSKSHFIFYLFTVNYFVLVLSFTLKFYLVDLSYRSSVVFCFCVFPSFPLYLSLPHFSLGAVQLPPPGFPQILSPEAGLILGLRAHKSRVISKVMIQSLSQP